MPIRLTAAEACSAVKHNDYTLNEIALAVAAMSAVALAPRDDTRLKPEISHSRLPPCRGDYATPCRRQIKVAAVLTFGLFHA
jgi:hypothetical protein